MSVERQENKPRVFITKEDLRKSDEIKKGPKEKLGKLRQALEKTEPPKTPLKLKEAASFLSEIGEKLALKPSGYPSHTTLEELIKTAVILGDFPLSEGAVRVTSSGRWFFNLSKKDLLNVLDVNLKIIQESNLSVEESYQLAQEKFREKRKRYLPIETLFPAIFQRLGYSGGKWTTRKTRGRKTIIENLQKGKLPPFYEVKPQEILVLGVFPEDQEDLIDFWAEFIKEEREKGEKLLPTYIYKNWPALSSFLKEQLSEEIKIDSRFLPYAVAWLKAKGMPVETVRRGRPRQKQRRNPIFYHRISSQGKKQLESLLKIPKKREELKRILRGGFSLEEILGHQKYFPSEFHLPLTELWRLATGKRRWFSKEQKTQNIKTLEDNHISVIEELTFEGTLLHKVPLSEAKRAVALLERLKPEKKPVVFSTVQLGKTIPISPTWIRQLAHQGLIGHHPGPETHWKFSQEDFNILKQLAEIKIEPRSNLISLRDARRKVGLSREKLIALCRRRKNPLFSPKGKPRLKEEIKEKGRYCLRMTDFEAILREGEILAKEGYFDVS